jgi:hypothetical protein
MTITGLEIRRLFPKIKSRYDKRRPVHNGLICKQGLYRNCCVVKLQKPSWTNDPMDRTENETGIFFSVWVRDGNADKANYNIHAFKLKQLKGYSIASRDFAEDFRRGFACMRENWPNVSTVHGPRTLMQGWIEVLPARFEKDVLALMKNFEDISPLIDRLLDLRRK